MYARIYPMLRLPRRFGVFDYRIPDGMRLSIGDCVRVPFHGRAANGIVAEIAATTDVMGTVCDIETLAWPSVMTPEDVTRIVALAASIAQSPATILAHLFGTMTFDASAPAFVETPKTQFSLGRDAADVLGRALNAASPNTQTAVQTTPEGALALAQLLRKKYKGQLLVLAPRERDADLAARLVSLGPATAVLHGATKPRQRERIIRAWRSGLIHTLIGTRQASLLPAYHLDAVLVLSSGTSDHFNDRRNPRFDTRNTAFSLALQHRAVFIAADVLPRPEDVAVLPTSYNLSPIDFTTVDLRDRMAESEHALLTQPLLDAMKTALQSGKKVLLFYNRKGVAKRAQCRKCSQVLVCDCGLVYGITPHGLACGRCGTEQNIPDFCPHCNDGIIGLRGIGNAHIAKSLSVLFPDVAIGRVEKGHVENDARVILATEYFFSSVVAPFCKKEFGLVADLAADLSLHPDNFRSGEETARKLHRLSAFADRQGAACIVQTWLPDDINAMRDAHAFLQHELAIRERYGLPPHRAVVTVRHADADALTALTGQYFAEVDNDTIATRVLPKQLFTFLFSLFTLPDTAVIAVDAPYTKIL